MTLILPSAGRLTVLSSDRKTGAHYLGSCTFAELLIDCEEDQTPWGMLVGLLREVDCQANGGLRQPQ
jgi:hypothetical protein